jgi:hypothetical protein
VKSRGVVSNPSPPAPAYDTCYEALCLNAVSRLAHYEARVAVNAAGNDWERPK